MTDYIAYAVLSAIASVGVYYHMRDGDNADFMIEQRPDRDAFIEHLKKAPIKEKIHFVLRATHYVKNKPIIKA
jgi:hypothetical protein